LKVAVTFDREGFDRLARLGDALRDAFRPVRLDTDDHRSGHVGVRTGAYQRPKR
jgi:hypothetical protein